MNKIHILLFLCLLMLPLPCRALNDFYGTDNLEIIGVYNQLYNDVEKRHATFYYSGSLLSDFGRPYEFYSRAYVSPAWNTAMYPEFNNWSYYIEPLRNEVLSAGVFLIIDSYREKPITFFSQYGTNIIYPAFWNLDEIMLSLFIKSGKDIRINAGIYTPHLFSGMCPACVDCECPKSALYFTGHINLWGYNLMIMPGYDMWGGGNLLYFQFNKQLEIFGLMTINPEIRYLNDKLKTGFTLEDIVLTDFMTAGGALFADIFYTDPAAFRFAFARLDIKTRFLEDSTVKNNFYLAANASAGYYHDIPGRGAWIFSTDVNFCNIRFLSFISKELFVDLVLGINYLQLNRVFMSGSTLEEKVDSQPFYSAGIKLLHDVTLALPAVIPVIKEGQAETGDNLIQRQEEAVQAQDRKSRIALAGICGAAAFALVVVINGINNKEETGDIVNTAAAMGILGGVIFSVSYGVIFESADEKAGSLENRTKGVED